MPEKANPATSKGKARQPAVDAGHIPITEEMDSAKWTLPPVVPIVIALVAVAIVIAAVSYSNRQTPTASGSITQVLSSDQQGNVLVAVHLNFRNEKEKPVWIRQIDSELQTADGQKFTDHAAPGSDLDRYLRGAPELAEGRLDPLKEEMKILAHTSQAGMVIFAYPVTKAVFDARKSLNVRVDFYDNPPLVLTAK